MTCGTAFGMRLARVPVPTSVRVREALARRWLAERELTLLPPRSVEKRRCEFVAGRLAAKAAGARLRGVRPARDAFYTIVADGECAGRPIAVDAARAPIPAAHLSITHSAGVAVAAAAVTPVGVDLTPAEPCARSFDEEAFLDGELDAWQRLLGASPPARTRAAAFAAKEAALKWLGVGLRAALHDVRVTPSALGDARECADLCARARPLTVRVHVRRPLPGAGVRPWWSEELHGLVSDVGRQVLVGLAGEPRDESTRG